MAPKPLCFMVMPFGTKETGAAPGAPSRIDFNALWDKALAPLIERLGYRPVRADQDLGASIILDMLERLYFSDLVLADMTIPNGNVYYEIGVRHAMKRDRCVLISADWSRQLFDLQQIRQARYPLQGEITEAAAAGIQAALSPAIAPLATGATPVFQTLAGYPGEVAPGRETVIRAFLDELGAFQVRVGAVRTAPKAKRRDGTIELRDAFPPADIKLPNVALELFGLLRDYVGWSEALSFVDALGPEIRSLPILGEQRCLVQSMSGAHAAAIAALEELIERFGDSSERQGLLGGRYKRLYREASDASDRARYLAKAIEHYERGTHLDLNDFYPSCNLPGLYRARGRRGDEERARAAATVARMACERALARSAKDEWIRPTLLGLAFHEGDLDAVDELCERVAEDGPVDWKLESTVADLGIVVTQTRDETKRAGLTAALARLQLLLVPRPSPALTQ